MNKIKFNLALKQKNQNYASFMLSNYILTSFLSHQFSVKKKKRKYSNASESVL